MRPKLRSSRGLPVDKSNSVPYGRKTSTQPTTGKVVAQVTLQIDARLWRQLDFHCINTGQKRPQVVEEALRRLLG